MRAVAVLALLLAPGLCQDDEAERACREMEKRLLEAKTVRLAFTLTLEVDKRQDQLKGGVWLAEANKARIEVSGTMGNKPLEMLTVSDGVHMIAKVNDTAAAPRETPRGTGELIRGTLGRAGMFAGLFYNVKDTKEPALDDLFQSSDFKLQAREKMGNHDILVVEYKLGFRGAAEKGTVTTWIDAESHLPLKRVFTINDAARKVRITETYSDLVLNTDLESKHFTLPKE